MRPISFGRLHHVMDKWHRSLFLDSENSVHLTSWRNSIWLFFFVVAVDHQTAVTAADKWQGTLYNRSKQILALTSWMKYFRECIEPHVQIVHIDLWIWPACACTQHQIRRQSEKFNANVAVNDDNGTFSLVSGNKWLPTSQSKNIYV